MLIRYSDSTGVFRAKSTEFLQFLGSELLLAGSLFHPFPVHGAAYIQLFPVRAEGNQCPFLRAALRLWLEPRAVVQDLKTKSGAGRPLLIFARNVHP